MALPGYQGKLTYHLGKPEVLKTTKKDNTQNSVWVSGSGDIDSKGTVNQRMDKTPLRTSWDGPGPLPAPKQTTKQNNQCCPSMACQDWTKSRPLLGFEMVRQALTHAKNLPSRENPLPG